MSGILLLRPEWLIVAALIALAGAAQLWRARGAAGGWERAVDPALMAALAQLGRVERGGRFRAAAPIAAAALTAAALSGPALERRAETGLRDLDGLVVAIDLSDEAAAAPDFETQLVAARIALAAAGSKSVGLVLYAGDAYAVSPLTLDARALGGAISSLEAGIVPDPGARPERALEIARDLLAGSAVVAGDVALFTGGGGLGPAVEAKAAALRAEGFRVSVIAAAPDAAAEAVAAAGGGLAAPAETPEPVAALIASGFAERIGETAFSALLRADMGRWGLLLAMAPALFLFAGGRRRDV